MEFNNYVNKIYEKLIPKHVEGKKLDLVKKIQYKSTEESEKRFIEFKNKLRNVNNWYLICKKNGAEFLLHSNTCETKDVQFIENSYLRINIPGPGSNVGDGYDWVIIDSIIEYESEGLQFFGFMVRASENPCKSNTDVAHFFNSNATSSFILYRNNLEIILSYHGRNELPNINSNNNFLDKIRNSMISIGSMLGLSKNQWKLLLNGIANN